MGSRRPEFGPHTSSVPLNQLPSHPIPTPFPTPAPATVDHGVIAESGPKSGDNTMINGWLAGVSGRVRVGWGGVGWGG